MLRQTALVSAFVLFGSALVHAQVTTTQEDINRITDIRDLAGAASDYDYTEHLPSVNVRGKNVAARAPGTWVVAAIARYTGTATGGGGNNSSGGTTTGTGSTADTSGLSGLSGLLGGNAGGLGSLLNLLGGSSGLTGLTGLSGTVAGAQATNSNTTTGSLAGGSTTGGTNGQATPRYTIDDLLAMRGGSGSDSAAKLNNTAQTKADARSQTTDDRPFRVRLLDSVLNTVFLGISAAFQSQDFIDIIKDQLRPVFFPQNASSADSTGGGDNTDGGNTDGGNTDGGGDGSGGI